MSRPRIRTLKPEFFGDAKINAISRDARYLTIGLITRADDRGRQQHQEPGILGHVFPEGDVSMTQLRRWLAEIFDVGIAWRYTNAPKDYLWLPNFWRHQKINRPSESDCPAHPDDPFSALSIGDALKAWRENSVDDQGSITEDSLNTHGALTPSRVGGRSAPFLSPDEPVATTEELDARTIFDVWRDRCSHPNAKLSPERLRAIRARIKEHVTEDELRQAIEGAARAPHVSPETGQRFDDIELICRNRVKLDSFIARANSKPGERTARKASNAAAIGGLLQAVTG